MPCTDSRRQVETGKAAASLAYLLTGLLVACSEPVEMAGDSAIRFDLEHLNAEGLQGPPDGLRALHYEFCLPDEADVIKEVSAIDPTLQFMKASPGRIGCGEDEVLCLGHTHQPNHRQVLQMLDRHPRVGEIHEAVFE